MDLRDIQRYGIVRVLDSVIELMWLPLNVVLGPRDLRRYFQIDGFDGFVCF
jgi:hypothetical protein